MSADERRQAELLDTYWLGLKRTGVPSPPGELEQETAELAAALERELSAPEPSSAFTNSLRQRLHAEAHPAPSSNGIAPGGADATEGPVLVKQQIGAPLDDLPRKPRWIVEIGKLAAAVVAFALLAGLLIVIFGRGDGDGGEAVDPDDSSSVAGEVTASSGEILVAMAPGDGVPHKLFIVSTDGSEPRKLTPGRVDAPELEASGDWSPDGGQIAFASRDINSWQLWLINADGSNMRAIGPNLLDVSGIDWSPDGTRLAFAGTPDGNAGAAVCVLPITEPAAMICSEMTSAWAYAAPQWSPDGTRIAYEAYVNRRYGEVVVMNADLTDPQLLLGSDPQWSPNGTRIALSQRRDSTRGGVWVAVTDSSFESHARGYTVLTSEEMISRNPRWLPDGSIAFVITDRGGSVAGIAVGTLTGQVRKITDLVGSFEVSADGEALAVVATRLDVAGQPDGAALYVVNVHGSGERLLLEAASLADTLAWRPGPQDAEPDMVRVEATPLVSPTESPTVDVAATSPPPTPMATEAPAMPAAGELVVPLDLDGDGHSKLYLVGADGREPVKLTSGADGEPGSEKAPVWSPDGERLLYTSWTVGAEPRVVNVDGSGEQNLSDGLDYFVSAVWSPDGTRIAYVGHDGNRTRIYVMDADGSGVKALTQASANDFQPVWSPDGQQLAFVRAVFVPDEEPTGVSPELGRQLARSTTVEGEYEFHLWLVNADGSGARSIAAVSSDPQPRWSPDGREIAFTAGWLDAPRQAQIVDVESGEIRSVVTSAVTSSQPRWSPDGAWLSVIVVDPGGSESSIVVVRPDGAEARRVGMGAGWWHEWSPDGAWIAVARSRLQLDGTTASQSDLALVNAVTGEEISLLVDVPIERSPAWRPVAPVP